MHNKTYNKHKTPQWEQQSITNQQQQNRHLKSIFNTHNKMIQKDDCMIIDQISDTRSQCSPLKPGAPSDFAHAADPA